MLNPVGLHFVIVSVKWKRKEKTILVVCHIAVITVSVNKKLMKEII